MAEPTPIEALDFAMRLADPRIGGLRASDPDLEDALDDARRALVEVETVVAAVRQRPCLGVARDGNEDECLVTDVPTGLWCWRCKALARWDEVLGGSDA